MSSEGSATASNFIYKIMAEDLEAGRCAKVVTRFPPEPNGYLHIGHAKSICLNFGAALAFDGECNLRFDDTNPVKEEDEYVKGIREDVAWLGFDWKGREFFASDYFDELHGYAVKLIEKGLAYVDQQTGDQIRETRGTLTKPGIESPYRDRPVEENLALFEKMRSGELDEGECVLRAKIDMASGNLNMRDPVLYRILKVAHHRTGNKWCIYPMYDFAHGQSDSIEGVTHSVCTLEFEDHRPLYDWFIQALELEKVPRQYEFARLNLSYTVMSKRKLLELVERGYMDGWDDPRMPTLAGMRRRGYPPGAIREFCDRIGVAKKDSMVDVALLEFLVREELNRTAQRRMAVLNPLKVVITNYPEGESEDLEAANNPENPDDGVRKVPFSRELFIEREDFMEEPVKKFFRLAPGREVRLRFAYFVKCEEVIKDESGEIVELRCTYDPATTGGQAPDGRKVKATLHWVSASHAVEGDVNLYDRLFLDEKPEESGDFRENLNPDALVELKGCKLEPSLGDIVAGGVVQFERLGYFCRDDKGEGILFNRAVTLRDQWAKAQKKK